MHKIKTILANRRAYIKRYLWPLPKFRREFVVMVDGKMTHGGLTDRFRHILSIYGFCKIHSIPFRIYYVYPCRLTDILLPGQYDWTIRENEISQHFLGSSELDMYIGESGKEDYYNAKHLEMLEKARKCRCHKQYHIYGNAFFGKGQYRTLFRELFKPAPYLEARIATVRSTMPAIYESVTLRFQCLLGDLKEKDYEVLTALERETLINKCIKKIEDLWESRYFSTTKVLVTSDSSLFLSRIAVKDFVCTIPGPIEHMDYSQNSDIELNSRPFVDLFLLKNAQRLTMLLTGKMYRSGFPAFAAELGNRPFEEIVF